MTPSTEQPTKKIITPVSVCDDNYCGFNYAIVNVDQDDIDRIRAMHAIVQDAKAKVRNGLYKLVAFDGDVTVMTEDSDAEKSDDGRIVLTEPDEYDRRIECVCLNVTDNEFFWTFYPKHTNIHCETDTYLISVLDTFDTIDDREQI